MTHQPTPIELDEDRPFSEPLQVKIWQDMDTENPSDYGLFRLVSFNSRMTSFEDPDTVLACQFEWPDPGDPEYPFRCEDGPHSNQPGEYDEWPAHQYQPDPDIVAFLSYFEHGSCRWSRQGMGPSDYGGFDTVRLAGVLIWNGEESERGWWSDMPIEDPTAETDRNRIIDGFLDEYTNWCNGETYGFTIESVDRCKCCGQPRHDTDTLIESVGGFIGSDYMLDEVRAILANLWHIDVADLVEGIHYVPTGEYEYLF